MKQRKLKKILLKGMALGICLSPWTMIYAAQQEMLWGNANQYAALLKKFSLVQPASTQKGLRLPVNIGATNASAESFRFVKGDVDYAKRSHVRYNQYYQGIPVWGSQVIYHVDSGTLVTGSVVTGIEKDVPSINGKISVDQIKQIALGKNVIQTPVMADKIIYFDENVSKSAVLAWHVTYMVKTSRGPTMPTLIVDANSGKILKEWDGLPTAADSGVGLGGTVNRHEYKYGMFQSPKPLNSLGNLFITYVTSSICTFNNDIFKLYNLKNQTEPQLNAAGISLPVTSATESRLFPFAYYCSGPNLNDNGFAPVNGGISPVNDVAYFVKQTMWMLYNMGLEAPVGSQMPVRVYTHVGELDNAFACDALCVRGMTGQAGPQQLVFGNGQTVPSKEGYPPMFMPLTEGDVVAHELGHLVTSNFSKLEYSDMPGGMNEAFSDITGMAINDYMREQGKTWYWDGTDWTSGKSITKTGLPLRYFDEPKKDRISISDAGDFKPGMNPHFSSGVYNKAFYLLVTNKETGWPVKKAYQVFLDANMYYWGPRPTFISGACGVIQSAKFRGYPVQDVKVAFSGVGVDTSTCPA